MAKNDTHNNKRELDKKLDDALDATFPASDPVSVGEASRKPKGRADRAPAPLDTGLVKRLAKKVAKKKGSVIGPEPT